ncbi:MAG: 50S ribosomal protein L18 [Patescibacteria group bacterium]
MAKLIHTSPRKRSQKKIRAKISGTNERPRVAVFRSNKYLSAQVINDEVGKTLAAGTTKELKGSSVMEKVQLMGKTLASDAIKKGIKKVVFDRGGFIYTGKVKALAEALRAGGLEF